MAMARKALMALGIFATVMACLVGLSMLIILIIAGGPAMASYVAGMFGLGVLAEFLIMMVVFMALPAAYITYIKLDD